MRHTDPNQTERVREVFNDWARRGRADSMAESHTPFSRPAYENLGVSSGTRYLDIGCGNGYTVRWAAADGAEAVGIDIAEDMILTAEKLSSDSPNASFMKIIFPPAPFADGDFDAIFSMEVFYYLPDLKSGLDEVARILAPGGRFACLVDFYAENEASHSWPTDVGVAMNLLSEAEWKEAFKASGLDVLTQERIRVPLEKASEEWKATHGSLLTLGGKS